MAKELEYIISRPESEGGGDSGEVAANKINAAIDVTKTAIQSATIGTNSVPKSGTNLDLPPYTTLGSLNAVPNNDPRLDGIQWQGSQMANIDQADIFQVAISQPQNSTLFYSGRTLNSPSATADAAGTVYWFFKVMKRGVNDITIEAISRYSGDWRYINNIWSCQYDGIWRGWGNTSKKYAISQQGSSYDLFVTPILRLDGQPSNFSGTFTFARSNGLSASVKIDIAATVRIVSNAIDNIYVRYITTGIFDTGLNLNNNLRCFVRFTYNGVDYIGIAYNAGDNFNAGSVSIDRMSGMKETEVQPILFYRRSPSATQQVHNQEIFDSIEYFDATRYNVFPTERLANPHPLIVQQSGTTQTTYDGSVARTIDILGQESGTWTPTSNRPIQSFSYCVWQRIGNRVFISGSISLGISVDEADIFGLPRVPKHNTQELSGIITDEIGRAHV